MLTLLCVVAVVGVGIIPGFGLASVSEVVIKSFLVPFNSLGAEVLLKLLLSHFELGGHVCLSLLEILLETEKQVLLRGPKLSLILPPDFDGFLEILRSVILSLLF